MWILQVHKTGAFVARQRENCGVRIGANVLHAELFIEAAHGAFGRVVVLAEVA